jgi:hypothetical protein
MALSADKKAMLKTQAAAGDIHAIEALALEATGRGGLVSVGAVAAKSATAVHAAILGTSAITPVTTGLTNPAHPRNVSAVAAATWDGGSIVVTGTDQFGAIISETLAAVASTTVYGTKVFKTITSIAHTAVGVAAVGCSVGTGDKLGLAFDVLDSMGLGLVQATAGAANTPEAVTVDPVVNAVTFTTAPDGTKVLCLVCNL